MKKRNLFDLVSNIIRQIKFYNMNNLNDFFYLTNIFTAFYLQNFRDLQPVVIWLEIRNPIFC